MPLSCARRFWLSAAMMRASRTTRMQSSTSDCGIPARRSGCARNWPSPIFHAARLAPSRGSISTMAPGAQKRCSSIGGRHASGSCCRWACWELNLVGAASAIGLGWLFLVPSLLYGGACLSAGVYLALSQRDLAACAAGPAAMIMHQSWAAGFSHRVLRSWLSRAPQIAVSDRAVS